jgi:hypothetical protein
LKLGQGHLITTTDGGKDAVQWILYRNASLDVEGFCQYSRPQMTSPSQLCDWKAKWQINLHVPSHLVTRALALSCCVCGVVL